MKTFITAVVSLATAFSSWAGVFNATPQSVPVKRINTQMIDNNMFLEPIQFTEQPVAKTKAVASRAAEPSIEFTLAGAPYQAAGFENLTAGTKIAQAFEFSSENATQFAGNQITSFNFYVGGNNNTKLNQIFDYTIFITKDLEGEPIYTQQFTTDVTAPFTLVKATLDKPYDITAGEFFYIGMSYKIKHEKDYTLVVDYTDHGDDYSAGWAAIYQTDANGNETALWNNISSQVGFLCLGATISGPNIPANQISVDAISIPNVVNAETPFTGIVYFTNNGANEVETFEIEYTISGASAITDSAKCTNPLSYKTTNYITIPDFVCPVVKDNATLTLTVTKVNGIENIDKNATKTVTFKSIPTDAGFQKNVVIEEITGTWCGYCPQGIVTMEAVRSKFTDGSLIPICIHVNGSQRDPMYSSSWDNVASLGGGSVPSAVANRQIQLFPVYDDVIAVYDQLRAIPALGKVDVIVTQVEEDHSLNITTTTEFYTDMNNASNNYRLAFGVTADNVGPYRQTNYFAGGSNGKCDGWENKGSQVSTIYNDVAVKLQSFKGIENSIPKEVKGGEKYTYTYNMPVDAKYSFDKLHVIAYLIDTTTGAIENAATTKPVVAGSESGVEAIEADNANAPVEYFNLQGVRVENPENGIFIRRQGTSVEKVVIR